MGVQDHFHTAMLPHLEEESASAHAKEHRLLAR